MSLKTLMGLLKAMSKICREVKYFLNCKVSEI